MGTPVGVPVFHFCYFSSFHVITRPVRRLVVVIRSPFCVFAFIDHCRGIRIATSSQALLARTANKKQKLQNLPGYFGGFINCKGYKIGLEFIMKEYEF